MTARVNERGRIRARCGKVKERKRKRFYRPAASACAAGVAAALLIGGKEALAAIPNVEIVTLLCAVYGFTLGPLSLVSVLAFVTCEGAIYGFGSWIASYYIYWPLVAATFMLLKRLLKRPRYIVPTVAAAALTLFFGVLTSLADVGLLSGFFHDFWRRFAVYYMRGITFYVTQLICNLVLFPAAFVPLCRALEKCSAALRADGGRSGTGGGTCAPRALGGESDAPDVEKDRSDVARGSDSR